MPTLLLLLYWFAVGRPIAPLGGSVGLDAGFLKVRGAPSNVIALPNDRSDCLENSQWTGIRARVARSPGTGPDPVVQGGGRFGPNGGRLAVPRACPAAGGRRRTCA